MKSYLWLVPLLAVFACTKKAPVTPTPGAPPSLGSALNFGERKAEQITEILGEAERFSCAKTPLLDIYACQVGRYAEQSSYAADLAQMSCLPSDPKCTAKWDYSAEVRNRGNEFTATAKHKITGETWTINQGKVMEMPVAGTPPAKAP